MKHVYNFTFFILNFTLAFACLHANATSSTWAAVHVAAYSADKASDSSAGSDTSKASYSGYYCTVETATSLFGGATASAIEAALSKDYDAFSAAKGYGAGNGVTRFESVSFVDGEYEFLDYTGAAFDNAAYVAIAFYGAGNANGFQVFDVAELTPNGQLVFENDGSAGKWCDAPEQVPEPTSGLLLAVGLASVTLRRKRA